MAARMVSIYATEERVNVQDVTKRTSILDAKAQAKEGLKKKLGLADDAFHPTAKEHSDVWITVPTRPFTKISDEDTVATVCPDQSDYLVAVVPSAPAAGSPGNHIPHLSLLFPIQPHPDFISSHRPPSSATVEKNDGNDFRKLLSDLELKFEIQRKKDAEQVEAQRKQDAEKVEAQRKQDAEKVEAQRKKDAEKVEAQRKKDAAQAEAQRKQDAEKAEAQRKNDAEKVEEQRKKDGEKAEMQRKKDLGDANRKAEAWNRKLELDITELQNKVERLKKDASVEKHEAKLKYEATQRYIETLASDIDAATDCLTIGDEAGLDRIKRRNLLDRAQAKLALSLGITTDEYSASVRFREALGPSSSPDERRNMLLQMLKDKKDELSSQAAHLLTKPEALTLLAERFHRVRLDGDQVAHGHRERSWYENSVFRAGADKMALTNLLDYISPSAQ